MMLIKTNPKYLLILTVIKQIQPTSTLRLAKATGINGSTLRHYLYGSYRARNDGTRFISPLVEYIFTSVKGGLRLNDAGEELVKDYCVFVEDGKLKVGKGDKVWMNN